MTQINKLSLLSTGIRGIQGASRDISRAFTQLASGKRINRASDDAAGLALSSSIENQLRILEKASQSMSYSGSVLRTIDSTAQLAQDITGRLSELATQASNGTYSQAQRAALQSEFDGLTAELQRMGEAQGAPTAISIDSNPGASPSASTNISVGGFFYADALAAVQNVDLSSADTSRAGLETINTLSQEISRYRGDSIGSTQVRLEYAQTEVSQRQVVGAEALSRIEDIDIAEATAYLLQSQMRLQSSATLSSIGQSTSTDFIRLLLS